MKKKQGSYWHFAWLTLLMQVNVSFLQYILSPQDVAISAQQDLKLLS